MSEEKAEKRAVKVEVVLGDDVKNGSYVNLARIFHNQTEFILDALFLPPQSRQATVRSRLLLSPLHAKLLHAALGQNLSVYEEKFGAIQPRRGEDEPGGVLH
ncbi:MAG: DUF3467 domain-containing protein [Myxococcota bacterium]|nr:DUF3467 domain-containing protein [Myxococcota bacterium]MEE2779087.1 DUF3467 domain-containing protein [Myxococcota bacterium]